ncbi:uncharacterized protein LOC123562744 [Mercenaria mercenaria]|uniref:uncharacterized protein LOC123562744 n=1 Tax=Mercenaria mercenaria TaxID=6596 RepID=UPI00234E552A|nr:uncharacterized protein LOC123562744 [Mercenaria mercenaria]
MNQVQEYRYQFQYKSEIQKGGNQSLNADILTETMYEQGIIRFLQETLSTVEIVQLQITYMLFKKKQNGLIVCQIRFPYGTATGFRVGSKYIMTAYHVVKIIAEVVPSREFKGRHGQIHVIGLAHRNVFGLFEYFKEDIFEHKRKYFFKNVIHFKDEHTDVAVLELADNGDGQSMPLPFEICRDLNVTSQFTLIGHNGGAMKYNEVGLVIDRDATKTLDDIRWVKNHSLEQTNENFEFPPYNMLTNKQRVLFHCKFSKGASGSPGIVILENDHVIVVTMLLCGYPNWYYDGSVDRNLRSRWPKEYCIEQGADMASVARTMYNKNRVLYQDIFNTHLPEPFFNTYT